MVEIKNPAYWEGLSKKGEIESNISIEVENLMKKYVKVNPSTIFNKNSTPFSFSDGFTQELNDNLNTIFAKFPDIAKKGMERRRSKYLEQIYEYLYIVVST